MKKRNLSLLCLAFLAFACQEDEDPVQPQPTFENQESEWIRIAAWDASGRFSMMNPLSGNVVTPSVNAFAEGSRNHVSPTGQYITSIERAAGVVRFFDTGIVNHEDHGHEYDIRWLGATAEAPLPTHYSSTWGNIVIFNDGDGSITWAREAVMETPSFQPVVLADLGNEIHHGAATWLNGNKFAVTYKNPDVPGALPQTIKLLDRDKKVLAENESVSVTGIHGDASNGVYAIFGGTTGVLVASSSDQLFKIDNIEPLASSSGDWMGTIKAHDANGLFYGWSRNKGVFAIDPGSQSMRNVYAGDDVAGFFFSADGSKLIIQRSSNEVLVLDASSGSTVAQAAIPVAMTEDFNARKSMDEFEVYRLMNENPPVLTSSEKYLYVLRPSRTAVDVLDLNDLATVKTMELSESASTIMRVGFQTK